MLRDIEKRKGRTTLDPDDTYVRSRAEDRSIWVRLAFILEKYKALVWVIFLVLVALGFDFRTPKAQFDEIRATIKSSKEALQVQIDSIKRKQANGYDANALNFLIRTKCADLSPNEIYRLGGSDVCNYARTTENKEQQR